MKFQKLLEDLCEANEWTMTSGEIVVPTPKGRTQAFRWNHFEEHGRELARLWTVIGPESKLTPTRVHAALSLNFSMAFGALAIGDESLCMTQTFLISDADEAEVEASLRSMAEVADRYERLIYGGDAH